MGDISLLNVDCCFFHPDWKVGDRDGISRKEWPLPETKKLTERR